MKGLTACDLGSGTRYVRLHYSADPEKTPEWAEAERLGIPKREWEQQMEMREDVYDGEPVYADYRDTWHCRDVRLELRPGSAYVGGWDCGQTLTPAFILLEVSPKPWQVRALLEVISPGAEPMETFAPRVLMALTARLPGRWDEVEHWGDATVTQRAGTNGDTAQMVAQRHGVRIRPASNEWQGRYSAVTWLLTDDIDAQTPRFLVDGVCCPVLREGFRGAYRLEESVIGDAVGPGRVLRERPRKDGYSHIHDALQYAACRIRKTLKGGELDVRRMRR